MWAHILYQNLTTNQRITFPPAERPQREHFVSFQLSLPPLHFPFPALLKNLPNFPDALKIIFLEYDFFVKITFNCIIIQLSKGIYI